MPSVLMPNGTVSRWLAGGTDVLFPEQRLTIGGKKKLRGGIPFCCPVFGRVPRSKLWSGVKLPQHGLVRQSAGGREFYRSAEHWWEVRLFSFDASEEYPWTHTARVAVNAYGNGALEHRASVSRQDDGNPKPMPLSFAVHPYFATHGEPFTISWDEHFVSSDDIEHDVSLFWRGDTSTSVRIDTALGVVTMSLGGDYSALNIWTDDIGRYICGEPVAGKTRGPLLLEAGATHAGECTLTYQPH